ncbi:GntR family transcriptional regulator [Aquabacterium humicola]|uniref:GntR family transcriptional regulator n=1 Tax=Aquabacterium humicola TaxID=3237377 RepID=UPI0025435984|nr:GntR family transcriptional regulator [Rubrivivax pictus]
MNAPLPLERPQLLTDRVCERIREAIVRGELKLGEQVSEAQLAQRMDVSKTPVREALLRLKRDGLVEIHPQRGTFVFRLEPAEVTHLCRYRVMMETAALREAMLSKADALAADMARAVTEMRKAEKLRDLQALAGIDMVFHGLFFTYCDNQYLRAGYEVIRSQLVALRYRSPIGNAVPSHQVLVDVVKAGEAAKAASMLTEHILENEPRYRAACGVA